MHFVTHGAKLSLKMFQPVVRFNPADGPVL